MGWFLHRFSLTIGLIFGLDLNAFWASFGTVLNDHWAGFGTVLNNHWVAFWASFE